jgi:hypothetical protein
MLTQVSKLFSTRRIRGFIPYAGALKGPRNPIFYGAFAASLIATLLFVTDLNNPFAGTVAVQPTSFNISLQRNVHTRFLTRPVRGDSSGFTGELGISSSRELR